MNLLILINAFVYAGAEKLAMDIGKSLQGEKNSVIVVGVNRKNNEMEADLCADLKKRGIKTYILDKQAGCQRVESVLKVCTIIKKEKIDLIHAHCSVPMMIGKISGFLCRIPVICTVHSTKGYSRRVEMLTQWLSSCYVAIGKSVENYLSELGIPAAKIRLIYNGIDFNFYEGKIKSRNFWQKFGLENERLTLLAVGRVTAVKNHLCLVKAVKKCADCNFPVQAVVLGAYDENNTFFSGIRNYIKDNNLENQVRFLGVQEDVAQFLRNADCFVMTSLFEGLSIAFLEAVAAGIPIIVTDLPFAHELNEIAQCSYIIPQNDDFALANAIMKGYFYTPDKSEREKFAELFSIECSAKKHLELYSDMLSRGMK